MIQLISWNHTSNDAYEMLKGNYIFKSSSWKHQELIDNYARGILLGFGKVISVRAPGTTRLIMYMKFANHHHG